MGDRALVVLDSSVGVKWVKPEPGRERARELIEQHRDGEIRIVVATHFLHEVVAVVTRRAGPDRGEAAWDLLASLDLTAVNLDSVVAHAAFEQSRSLGCSFHDALAPALAEMLDATLCSSDARAHARFAGAVEILG